MVLKGVEFKGGTNTKIIVRTTIKLIILRSLLFGMAFKINLNLFLSFGIYPDLKAYLVLKKILDSVENSRFLSKDRKENIVILSVK